MSSRVARRNTIRWAGLLIRHRCGRLSEKSPLSKPVSLGSKDLLKVSLTAKEGGKGKRPHQAFLLVKETETGLEAPFPLTVKDSGKGVVEIVGATLADLSPLAC